MSLADQADLVIVTRVAPDGRVYRVVGVSARQVNEEVLRVELFLAGEAREEATNPGRRRRG